MPEGSLDASRRILGANNAANGFSTANVVANADGTIIERQEYIQTLLLGQEPVVFEKSEGPSVDEDGGRFAVSISVVDSNSGPIAAANINIASVTYSLEKSTGGGAYSTAGITQPSGATKADGIVRLEFDFVAGEWAVGDRYRLEIGAVTATVGSTTYYAGVKAWSGTVLEDLDVKTAVDDIDTDLGEPNDAAVDPSGASGTAHAKLRGIGTDTNKLTRTALTNAETSNTVYYKIANAWEVQPATAIADTTVGSGAEENLLDIGADAGTPRFRLDSALCNVVSLGSNTSITFRLKAEINGTLTQIGSDVVQTATGAFDLLSTLLVGGSIASRHIRVTVTGNNAANDGSVAATFISSKAGV